MQQYKAGFDENKLKVRALENELLLTSKQLEEERSRQRDLKKKVDEVEEEKGLTNQQYEAKIAQVQEDMEELKNRLVAVTRYSWFPIFWRCLYKFVELSNRAKRRKRVTAMPAPITGKHVFASKRQTRQDTYSRNQARKNVTARPP